jgi:predicted dehydrogenase
LKVAIIGCGLIGQKRAKSLGKIHELIAVADINRVRAESLASSYPGCTAYVEAEAAINHPDVELVIISTTNNMLAPVTLAAVSHNKHVLVEKPAAKNAAELIPLIEKAKGEKVLVKVGFNHRFHPAFLKAREIWDTGELGDLMYIRARYGHGGRLGYEKEWRFNLELAGGGELLDQGVHLIDLARMFTGDFSEISGQIGTFYWDTELEDNGFIYLKTAKNQVAWLHASCTETKNLFSFEVICKKGKLQIDGLGGSYGVERLTYYKLLPELGPPETVIFEYPFPDRSWEDELIYFVKCIKENIQPEGNLHDAHAALEIIGEVYRHNNSPAASI